jgi:hypothetical protein
VNNSGALLSLLWGVPANLTQCQNNVVECVEIIIKHNKLIKCDLNREEINFFFDIKLSGHINAKLNPFFPFTTTFL